eukprot:1196055-Prorocentrum_minimum.AAC.2
MRKQEVPFEVEVERCVPRYDQKWSVPAALDRTMEALEADAEGGGGETEASAPLYRMLWVLFPPILNSRRRGSIGGGLIWRGSAPPQSACDTRSRVPGTLEHRCLGTEALGRLHSTKPPPQSASAEGVDEGAEGADEGAEGTEKEAEEGMVKVK